jgi:hypothetical protein
MKGKIFIHDWLNLKPYSNQVSTDLYYLNLSNEVKKILLGPLGQTIFRIIENKSELNQMACFLTSYLEDLVSGTNIWNAFVRLHENMYEKLIPFHDTGDYFEGEVNEQDIAILIWYYLNSIQHDQFVAPHNYFISELAESIFTLFEQEYEYAPANENLVSYYTLALDEDDYYEVRKMADIVLFNSYLFYPDTAKLLKLAMDDIKETYKGHDNLVPMLQEKRDWLLHWVCTTLLAKRGNEWVAEIVGSDHPLYADLYAISPKITGFFFYKAQNNTHIHIEHVASGEQFQLTKRSFDYYDELIETNSLIYMSIVRWQKDWWFSGIQMITSYNENVVAEERASSASKNSVIFLDRYWQFAEEVLEKQRKAFLEYNDGKLIAFMPKDRIQTFTEGFMEFYNGIIKKDWKDSYDKDMWGLENKHEKIIQDDELEEFSEKGLVFFNHKSGLEVAFGINSAFPCSDNPYFEEFDSNDAVMSLMESHQFSKELVMYCLDNYKDELQFFKDFHRANYLDDLDFLMRFWKSVKYHTKPAVTLD